MEMWALWWECVNNDGTGRWTEVVRKGKNGEKMWDYEGEQGTVYIMKAA